MLFCLTIHVTSLRKKKYGFSKNCSLFPRYIGTSNKKMTADSIETEKWQHESGIGPRAGHLRSKSDQRRNRYNTRAR